VKLIRIAGPVGRGSRVGAGGREVFDGRGVSDRAELKTESRTTKTIEGDTASMESG
jgi:hypothetical protein